MASLQDGHFSIQDKFPKRVTHPSSSNGNFVRAVSEVVSRLLTDRQILFQYRRDLRREKGGIKLAFFPIIPISVKRIASKFDFSFIPCAM